MNFGELLSELQYNLGNRSTTDGVCTTTRMKVWLNNAQIEIASAFQFFQTEAKTTLPMIVGTTVYDLPSGCLAIYDLRDTTKKRKILRAHYRQFDNVDLSISGDPTHYIRFANTFELGPQLPSAANSMILRYCKALTLMSLVADEPTLMQPWHECILLGGEYRGWRALGEVKRYIDTKNEYLAMVRSRNSEWEIEDGDEEFGLELVK